MAKELERTASLEMAVKELRKQVNSWDVTRDQATKILIAILAGAFALSEQYDKDEIVKLAEVKGRLNMDGVLAALKGVFKKSTTIGLDKRLSGYAAAIRKAKENGQTPDTFEAWVKEVGGLEKARTFAPVSNDNAKPVIDRHDNQAGGSEPEAPSKDTSSDPKPVSAGGDVISEMAGAGSLKPADAFIATAKNDVLVKKSDIPCKPPAGELQVWLVKMTDDGDFQPIFATKKESILKSVKDLLSQLLTSGSADEFSVLLADIIEQKNKADTDDAINAAREQATKLAA